MGNVFRTIFLFATYSGVANHPVKTIVQHTDIRDQERVTNFAHAAPDHCCTMIVMIGQQISLEANHRIGPQATVRKYPALGSKPT